MAATQPAALDPEDPPTRPPTQAPTRIVVVAAHGTYAAEVVEAPSTGEAPSTVEVPITGVATSVVGLVGTSQAGTAGGEASTVGDIVEATIVVDVAT